MGSLVVKKEEEGLIGLVNGTTSMIRTSADDTGGLASIHSTCVSV